MTQLAKLFLIFSIVPGLLAQQPAPNQAPPEPPREGSVSGMVIDVTTQEPMGKVSVLINAASTPGLDRFSAQTDEEGKFSVGKITPGRYSLSLYRNGFVYADEGVKGSIQRGGVLDVGPGQVIDEVVLGMQPAAVINGRVVDEDGEPIEGLLIDAAKFRYVNGSRELNAVGRSTTDDKGEYRIYGLAPDDYYVRVNMDQTMGMGGGRFYGLNSGYVDTYYPQVADVSQASPLRVSAQAETQGIDFRMVRTKTLGISGVILTAAGARALGGSISLLDRNKSGRQYTTRRVQSRPDGKFETQGLPPGSYRLEALVYSRDRSSNAAIYDFDLTDHSLTDITIRAQPTFSVKGRMVIEGEYDENASPFVESVVLEPAGAFNMRAAYGIKSESNEVTFQNLTADSYKVRGGNMGSLYLKSARYDGRDAIKTPVRVEEDDGEFEIVLSANGARVDGQITRSNEGVSGAHVVLIPEDRDRMDLSKFAATDQYGVFGLEGIAPGRYKLFAWERIERGAWLDPKVLAEVENQGVRVELQESESKRVVPKLIDVEKD